MPDTQIFHPNVEAPRDPMLSALIRDLMERLRVWVSLKHPERDPDAQLRELAQAGRLRITREDHSGEVRGQPAELVQVAATFDGEPLVSFDILWHGGLVVSISWKGLGRFHWRDEEGTRKRKGDGKPSPLEAWRSQKLGEGPPD